MVTVHRHYMRGGVLGELFVDDEFVCFSLERPWKDNKKNDSCIPAGDYTATKHTYTPKRGRPYTAIKLLNVPDRTGIYWHIGNKVGDSLGCGLVGGAYSGDQYDVFVSHSALALQRLLALLPDGEFSFKVIG